MAVKKVTAFVGAARTGYTHQAAREFLDQLMALGAIETELVRRLRLRLADIQRTACRAPISA